ncbi:hypothetical protein SAMN05421821_105136 [Mucilaginibacter lappiensis]|uniref:Phage major capsid protein E n=1 Tax=Mucilaginibacter lappiensis TaxID=354630 RepID=A0ABR6PIX6_9SPHI|nr:hypothetical protein [Mucilaginibacter lappiensis]MBB6109718.1 hypothetical protein [Mucilaginibacter lappiensis]SIR12983.1 hypothetical protein SAMN05421821_105136 [Mucilaginibacter lappiensis]
METSAFVKWVAKYLPGVTIRIIKTLNDTSNPLPYLFKTLLKPQFSVDGKWEALIQENVLVSADYVAMDSSAPLKKRDSMGKASGEIPKMAMELWLNEKQLTDLDSLIAQNGSDAQIVAELFKDTKKTLGGAYELNEATFLEALSTGQAIVSDADNVGTGIRMDYGYLSENKFGVAKLLTDSTYKYWDDVQKIVDKATLDGNAIQVAYTDGPTINLIAALDQTKQLYAFGQNFVGNNIPAPDIDQLNAFTKKRYGFVFAPVNRSIRKEKNGKRQTKKPWKAGSIVYTSAGQVGSLVYAKLAEQNHPVAGVTYELVDGYILISKYRKNEPAVSEYTKMQARVVPVISNVDEIYLQDTTTIQA